MTIYIDPLVTNKIADFQTLYAKLERYAAGNSLYDDESNSAYTLGKWLESMKPLRNVAPRSVEFYANKIMPGKVQVVTGEEGDTHPLLDTIEQVLKWSNFDEKKQLYLRDMSKLGDLFIKVMVEEDKVHLQQIPAEHVVDFSEDTRGYLESIRIETEIPDGEKTLNRIEFYSKKTDDVEIPYFAVWETNQAWPTPIDQLGDAKEWGPLAGLGVDFVPFVHAKYKDTGALRGQGCFTHALDKIDEANRQATRLARQVFKEAGGMWWIKSDAKDKDGRPLPASPIKDINGNVTNAIERSDDAFMDMPAGREPISTVPNIAWEAIRNIANDMVEELKEDMPELRYYSQTQGANLSGKALSYMLAPALDRAREAGSNFTAGLIRALQMALTMGQFARILPVAGSYDAGDFDFDITIPEAFEPDNAEKAQTMQALKNAGLDLPTSMKLAGFSQEITDGAQKAADEAMKAKAAVALDMVNKISVQNDAARKEAADKKASEAK